MPIEITVPRQGWSMDEGRFLDWLKKDGEAVKESEPLFSLESDKAAFDVESPGSGILRIEPAAPKPGDVVKVGCVLGYLLADGETLPTTSMPAPAVVAITSVAAALAESVSLPVTDPEPSTALAEKFPASPRARRAANELQVELAAIRPTGTGGRIRERDVIAAAPQTSTEVAPKPASLVREVPITAQRRTIAGRMMESWKNTAPVTLTCRTDASQLVSLRNQIKSTTGTSLVPSYTDIITMLTARALRSHLQLAGRWEGNIIVLPDAIHIGIAVDTEQGLIVPVVQNVLEMSLWNLARQSRDLIEAARTRRLKAKDMQGACFTISNLGGFGIDTFTPIINYPETAILGLGVIRPEPAVLADGCIGIQEQIALSLTFDHRVVDGAPAARFLQTLREGIESPLAWLLTDMMSPAPLSS